MLAVAILAAGKGTRMVSSLPKVLHKLSGKTLLQRILDTSIQLKPDKIFIVIGHKSELIKRSLSSYKNINQINFVLQEPQLGTGHAVQTLSKNLINFKGNLLILNGDVPLIKTNSLKKLLQIHNFEKADASLITTKKEDPFGYGRILLKDNFVDKIIEEKDCSPTEKLNKNINAGIYCFNFERLLKILNDLNDNNSQKEIYLTDTISYLKKSISYELNDDKEIQGVNSRVDLANCEKIIQEQLKEKHMLNGVTFINPESSSVSEESEIGKDVTIEANTHILGKSKISDNCIIGPNSYVESSYIYSNSKIFMSTVLNSEIMENVQIGPYSHIRPGCSISSDCKIGNFVEIKNSLVGCSSKINHLSYLGDSIIGKSTNIGAGSITANFNGIQKNKTIIGDKCNIGCNTVFIAPINLGDSVTTGAGSIITKNVEKDSLAISRVKQKNIENWKK